tara:strand:- start:304 stop:861 length:558 start_codon:yes stop_codon:yes gene_type:complete
MARTPYKMKGMSFKEGQTPLKNLTQEAFAAGEPGSSKNDLITLANDLAAQIPSVNPPDLDYGGGFDMSINLGTPRTSKKPKKVAKQQEKKLDPKNRIDVKGANEQAQYKSGGGFGKDNKDIKAPDVKTYKQADESKDTPEPKIKVKKPTKPKRKAGDKNTSGEMIWDGKRWVDPSIWKDMQKNKK